jgi:hypothetical protein
MRIALIPGSFKPYHAGHDALIRKAASENDRVIVFYSTADRARPGELAVSGENSSRIMNEYVSHSLPGNVSLVASKVPVRSVFELLTEVDNISNDSYAIYSDSEDIARYRTISKYAPNLANSRRIDLKEMARGEDSPNISGTSMRNFIMSGDVNAFRAGLPLLLRPKAEEIFDLLGGVHKRPLDFGEKPMTRQQYMNNPLKIEAYKKVTTKESSLRLQEKSSRKNKIREKQISKNRQLLEEFANSDALLLEDYSGYDSWSTSPNLLVKTFVAPFANVVNASKAAGLDIMNVTAIPLRALVAKIGGSDTAFKDAMAGYKRSEARINKMWEPVKKFNNEALSGDAQLLAFGFAPHEYVTATLVKTFKEVIAGRAGDAESGLIGAIAAAGFLPDAWEKSWRDFSENAEEKDELRSDEESRARELQRTESKNELNKLVPKLLASLTALGIYDSLKDKTRENLAAIKNNEKYHNISYQDVEDIRELIAESEDADSSEMDKEDRKKLELIRRNRRKLNLILDKIERSRGEYSRQMRATGFRYNPGSKEKVKEAAAALRQLSAGSREFLRSSFSSLRECVAEYSKTAIYASALFSSKNLDEMQRSLSRHGVSIQDDIADLQTALEKSIEDQGKEVNKDEVFKIAQQTIKAGLAKTIARRQELVAQQINQIDDTLKTDASTRKILESNEATKALLSALSDTNNTMDDVAAQMRDGKVKDATAKVIKALLAQIDGYLKSSTN